MFTKPAFDIVAFGALGGETEAPTATAAGYTATRNLAASFVPPWPMKCSARVPGRSRRSSAMPATRCCPARTATRWTRPCPGSSSWSASICTSTKPPAMRTSSCRPRAAGACPVRPDFPLWRYVMWSISEPLVENRKAACTTGKSCWAWLPGLGVSRQKCRERFQVEASDRFMRKLTDRGIVDLGLRLGPYGTGGRHGYSAGRAA